jgi:hypothetical protein
LPKNASDSSTILNIKIKKSQRNITFKSK